METIKRQPGLRVAVWLQVKVRGRRFRHAVWDCEFVNVNVSIYKTKIAVSHRLMKEKLQASKHWYRQNFKQKCNKNSIKNEPWALRTEARKSEKYTQESVWFLSHETRSTDDEFIRLMTAHTHDTFTRFLRLLSNKSRGLSLQKFQATDSQFINIYNISINRLKFW